MLKIKLQRVGRKNKPFYKIVLLQNLGKCNGKTIKELGFYDPIQKILKYKENLILYYLKMGAYPTNTVRHLIWRSLNNI